MFFIPERKQSETDRYKDAIRDVSFGGKGPFVVFVVINSKEL
jgi:hypothetical protein